MRVLLSCVPAVGHLAPLLPFAEALRRRDHEVAVVSGPGMAGLLPDGVPLLEAGPDLAAMLAAIPPRPPDAAPVDPVSPEGLSMFFGAMRAAVALDAARAAAERWRPDRVVSEGLDAVGLVLAAERGLPHTTVGLGPVCSRDAAGALRTRLEDLGLPVATTTWLDPWPHTLRPPGWAGPVPVRALGTDGGTSAPETGLLPEGDGPAVLVSFGSLFDAPAVLAPLLGALAGAGLRVVCTLGPAHEPGDLDLDLAPDGAIAGRVRVVPFRPLPGLLDAVDAVICHGGAGTVLAALARGRPVLVVPQGADHHLVAAGLTAGGAGRVCPDIADAPGAVADLLADDHAREVARRVAAGLASTSGPEAVVAGWELG